MCVCMCVMGAWEGWLWIWLGEKCVCVCVCVCTLSDTNPHVVKGDGLGRRPLFHFAARFFQQQISLCLHPTHTSPPSHTHTHTHTHNNNNNNNNNNALKRSQQGVLINQTRDQKLFDIVCVVCVFVWWWWVVGGRAGGTSRFCCSKIDASIASPTNLLIRLSSAFPGA